MAVPEVTTIPFSALERSASSSSSPPFVVPNVAKTPSKTQDGSGALGHKMAIRVKLLDNQEAVFQVAKTALTQDLLYRICHQHGTNDKEYFGLYLTDKSNANKSRWMKLDQSIKKQTNGGKDILEWRFKFYPPSFSVFKSETTKHLLCLQIQRDVVLKRLPAKQSDLIILGSLMVQIDVGTYDLTIHKSNYISNIAIAPASMRTLALDDAIKEKHRSVTSGMTTSEAVNQYVNYAQEMPLYGATQFTIKDSEMNDTKMFVSASGLDFYKVERRTQSFKWQQVLEMSYRRTGFCLTVRGTASDSDHERLVFKGPGEKATKRMWKFCAECHGFFRPRADAAEKSGLSRKSTFRLGKAKPAAVVPDVAASREAQPDIYASVLPRELRSAPMAPASDTARTGRSSILVTVPIPEDTESGDPIYATASNATTVTSEVTTSTAAVRVEETSVLLRESARAEMTHFPFPDPPTTSYRGHQIQD